MKFFARLIVVTVLAAFAASSVAYAAGSAEMTAAMIASDDAAAMGMSDCDACGDADAGQTTFTCNFICGAGGFVPLLVPQSQGMFQSLRQTLAPVVTQDLRGLTGPPAKQPPRTLI